MLAPSSEQSNLVPSFYMLKADKPSIDFLGKFLITISHPTWPRGYKTFFMPNLNVHEIYHAHKCYIYKHDKYNILEFESKKVFIFQHFSFYEQLQSLALLFFSHVRTCLPGLNKYYVGLVAKKPVFGVSDKASLKPFSSATETS